MARPLRIQGEGCAYHLTARGDRRPMIFRDDTDRGRFRDRLVDSLEKVRRALYMGRFGLRAIPALSNGGREGWRAITNLRLEGAP